MQQIDNMKLIKQQVQSKLDRNLSESYNATKKLDPMLTKKKMVSYLNNRIN